MNKILLVTTWFTILVFGCNKPGKDDYPSGVSFDLNGNKEQLWKVSAAAASNSSDSVFVRIDHYQGQIWDRSISIGRFTAQTNARQQIRFIANPSPEALYLGSNFIGLVGGDAICERYEIYEADSLRNFLVVTSYNQKSREIRGTFQATYVNRGGGNKCNAANPDTLRITNGSFSTVVKNF